MLSEAAARLLQSLLVLLTMSAVVFAGVYLIGNPLDMLIPPQASELERAQAGHALGLDQSLITQYLLFLQHALEGNLGRSFYSNSPALGLILDRLPATIELALGAVRERDGNHALSFGSLADTNRRKRGVGAGGIAAWTVAGNDR